MSKNDRFRRAVRGEWEQSHAAYLAWSEERRTAVQPAASAHRPLAARTSLPAAQ